jgi:RimJ/RimL family protein N-acetyltransferase
VVDTQSPSIRLRDVERSDVDAYVRMRCDPQMMAELGGPLPRDGIEAKVESDIALVASGDAWICMIMVGETPDDRVAGSVVMWAHDDDGDAISEIGWMVLAEFQGRGVGKSAASLLIERARDSGRWGVVHAFPTVSNGASNGICRSLGFTLAGQRHVQFAGRTLFTNHWLLDLPGHAASG